jgi:tetratricopeptide (TPR) repeat protein
VEAQTKVGASHWEQSQSLRRAGKTAEADAEQAKAIATLQQALKTRQDAGNTATDPALIGNACDLADIYLEISKPDDALKLLSPLAGIAMQTAQSGPAFSRLMADLLRAHVANNQVDQAMNDMSVLEKAGGGTSLTQLYYSLGKLLEKEMEALKKKGNSAALNRTKVAYQKFLTALAGSKSGQTYESLEWAGENMLTLQNYKEAEEVFTKILKDYGEDKKFKDQPGSDNKIFRTRIKMSAALRGGRKFGEAESLISQLIQENPRAIEPLMEKGMLLEDQAAAGKGRGAWSAAFKQWQSIAARLGTARVKPPEYYEAWYHAAVALNKEGKPKEAKQTLASIMRLSANVGGPEMKQKYKTMIDQIK